MITPDDIRKMAGGSFTGLSGTVNLGVDGNGDPWQTAAGSDVLVFTIYPENQTSPVGAKLSIAGMTKDTSSGTSQLQVFRKRVAAGETSWAATITAGGTETNWIAVEFPAGVLSVDYPFDAVSSGTSQAAPVTGPGTFAPGSAFTTAQGSGIINSAYDSAFFVLIYSYDTVTFVPPVLVTPQDKYVSLYEQQTAGSGHRLTLTMKPNQQAVQQTGEFWFDKWCAAPGGNNTFLAIQISYAAEGAQRRPDLKWGTGFEMGPVPTASLSAASLVATTVSVPLFSAQAGTPAIVSGGRSGNYCLEISASAAIEYVRKNTFATGTSLTGYLTDRLCFMFPTSLPAGDLSFHTYVNGSNADANKNLTIRYVSASQKIGVKFGGGTEVLSSATVVANQWIAIDLRIHVGTAATGAIMRARWRIDYNATVGDTTDPVTQTEATYTLASGAATTWDKVFGWLAAATGTVRFDDVAVAADLTGSAYPMGDVQILPSLIDNTVTPLCEISPSGTFGGRSPGSLANFALITNGVTGAGLTTGNLTTAATNLRTLSYTAATASGACQITTASQYIRFKLTGIDAADVPGTWLGLQHVVVGWAAAGTAATIVAGGWTATQNPLLVDGDEFNEALVKDTPFDVPIDPGWDATSMLMHTKFYSWLHANYLVTQSQPVTPWPTRSWMSYGISDDAAPDIGPVVMMAEVFYFAASAAIVVDNDGVTLKVFENPGSHAPVAYDLTAPAGSAARATYVIDGVTVDHDAPAGTTTRYKVNATSAESVTFVTAGRN